MIKIALTILLLSGPYASTNESTAAWRNHFEQVGVHINVVKTIRRPDFGAKFNTLSGWQAKHARALAWVRRLKIKTAILIVNPPIIDGALPLLYSGGISSLCKPKDGVSIAYVDDVNAKGEDRSYNKEIIIAHEVGHVLGMFHDDTQYPEGVSIMQSLSAAPMYIHPGEEFSALSVEQMHNCFDIWGIK